MTDRTRAQLIEQAARALDLLAEHQFSGTTDPQNAGCDSDEVPCTCGAPVSDWTCHHVDVLARAGMLADPEKAISLTYYQELAAGYKGQMARADALQTRIDAALVLVDGYATAFGDAKMLRRIRAELADVHPGRPVLPIADDDFDLLETEEL